MAVQLGGSSLPYDVDAVFDDGEMKVGWLGLGYAICRFRRRSAGPHRSLGSNQTAAMAEPKMQGTF